jgi:spermidine synthase
VRPWETLAGVDSPEGRLELRRRGDREFLITVAGRVLMNSAAQRSEQALAREVCGQISSRPTPFVLVGGLGMGLTLRAALDTLPANARVIVAELNLAIVEWCRGPLAELTDSAVDDPRVAVTVGDVADAIRNATPESRYDAILIDLYEGPRGGRRSDEPFYGRRALEETRGALAPGGVFGVWAESPDAVFEKRLRAAGFSFAKTRPGHGGLRHVVYTAMADR